MWYPQPTKLGVTLTSDLKLTLNMVGNEKYGNYSVDWGDGTQEEIYTTTIQKEHVYTEAGDYIIQFSPVPQNRSLKRKYYIGSVLGGCVISVGSNTKGTSCPQLTSVVFGHYASAGNPLSNKSLAGSSITEITFPKWETALQGGVCSACTQLQSVTILSNTPPGVANDSFASVPTTCVFHIVPGSRSAYLADRTWKTYMSKYTFIEDARE